ncbi:DUF1801 domain-containing protein [Leptospira ellisii]|uniref:DUF1801 domain-containing protein n=2 Tax=Leptospira ellisii TaxID=2023197 RepID=A0A2N0BB80_9LEPT|nr:DUF1801 domain-containing protein [Leptospira ellisii]MDV6237228.1 DUF1801 domain-containing protein [Leptospira ellisii]PJZ93800.1 hypothetical protein CH379_05940 [Leptospira ellisii]PKA03098.1 hypothetical protein CH375_19000 [Leptospira ellisii]
MSSEIHNYIDSQTETRKERLLALRSWIVDTFPEIQEFMKQGMPTYQLGKNWISIAAQKDRISIYLCDSRHLQNVKKKFPNLISGKTCLNIRDRDRFPLKEIQTSIKAALKSKTSILNGRSVSTRSGDKIRSASTTALRQNTRRKK